MNTLESAWVWVTRPVLQSGNLLEQLVARGATAVAEPLIAIEYSAARAFTDIVAKWPQGFDAVVVSSANGIHALGRVVELRGIQVPCYSIGPSTHRLALQYGLDSHTFPGVGSSDEFAARLLEKFTSTPKQRFLYIHSEQSIRTIAKMLRNGGHTVQEVAGYRTMDAAVAPAFIASLRQQPSDGKRPFVTVYSPTAAKSLLRQWPDISEAHWLHVVAIGKTTRDACYALGIPVHGVAVDPSDASLILTLERLNNSTS